MSDKNTPDVLDHAEAELQKLSTRHAFWMTDGPKAIVAATMMKVADDRVKEATWQRFQAYKILEDGKLWKELPKDIAAAVGSGEDCATAQKGPIQFCSNCVDGAKALGISRDTVAALKAVEQEDCAAAQFFALLPSSDLRRFARLDAGTKREIVAAAKDVTRLDKREAAEKLVDLISNFTAAANQAREQAEAELEVARKNVANAEANLKKKAIALDWEKSQAESQTERIRELQERLDTPGFCKGAEEIAGILRRHFDQTFAALGHFERAAEALAVRVEHGEPNEELNVIALQALEFAINLWGNAMGKYLPALDPGQEHISFWAANDTFTSPRTQEKINEYLNLLTPKTGKKGGDNE
jgi:hypothetical protein